MLRPSNVSSLATYVTLKGDICCKLLRRQVLKLLMAAGFSDSKVSGGIPKKKKK